MSVDVGRMMSARRSAAVLGAFLMVSLLGLTASAAAAGHITYRVGQGPLLRVEARAGAKPQDVSAGLDRRFPGGGDQFLNQSPDGKSLILQSERFGCGGNPCLAVASSNLRSGSGLPGQAAEGFSAVGNGGRVVVYPAQSSGGRIDLFVTRKAGRGWSKPRTITGSRPEGARPPGDLHGLQARAPRLRQRPRPLGGHALHL